MTDRSQPSVVLIGRPNTGKSTLFNTLADRKKSITSEVAGTTRNVVSASCSWQSKGFTLIDTGGLQTKSIDRIEEDVQKQVEVAMKQADVIVLLADIRTGPTALEIDIARTLQRSDKPVILVANKADSDRWSEAQSDFMKLGLGEPLLVSAIKGRGTGDLLDAICEHLAITKKAASGSIRPQVKIGVFGKPNVGKSSIINAILEEEKVIVSDVPGTTRDATDIAIKGKRHDFILVDTAGIRRRTKIKDKIDWYSNIASHKTIKEIDIALFVIDANEELSKQDLQIAAEIAESKKGLIILINKWDLILEKEEDKLEEDLITKLVRYYRFRLPFLSWATMLFTSATDGKNIKRILGTARKVYQERQKIVGQEDLDAWLEKTVVKYPPPSFRQKKRPQITEIRQVSKNPPYFLITVKGKQPIKRPYLKYLEKELRQEFGFAGTSLAIEIKE
ncbi:ribosome biogenesis GTPase Der [Patescibacteria group bacterium]|nr:ribosome biogenesis GTPase Der [Patescibacteria group bacterium]